jgi:flagellar motor component MotA
LGTWKGKTTLIRRTVMTKENFVKEYNAIADRALFLAEKGRREGLLALEEDIDEAKRVQRDIMEYGLDLIVNGTDPCFVNKILTNIVNLETENDRKTLKTIQKEAILEIQQGLNPRILLYLLNSYMEMGLEDVMKRSKRI